MKLFGRLFMGLALATCIGFAGCGGGDDAKKADPPKAPADGGAKDGASITPPSSGEMVLVSLQLPNMS